LVWTAGGASALDFRTRPVRFVVGYPAGGATDSISAPAAFARWRVATAVRLPQLPDVPTVAATIPGYEASALFGMGAPNTPPPEIVEKLNREINAVLAEPEIKKRLIELGGEPLVGSPEAFGAMIAAETEKWEKVVKFSGARIE
jgi:tripartite-type tricarboxylate transporter receptor subunit TctC